MVHPTLEVRVVIKLLNCKTLIFGFNVLQPLKVGGLYWTEVVSFVFAEITNTCFRVARCEPGSLTRHLGLIRKFTCSGKDTAITNTPNTYTLKWNLSKWLVSWHLYCLINMSNDLSNLFTTLEFPVFQPLAK